MDGYELTSDRNLIVPGNGRKGNRIQKRIVPIAFSAALVTGIIVCLICDLAISGSLTWSLIPTISIIYAWTLLFPMVVMKRKGVLLSLASLSIFTIPYLFLLSKLVKTEEVFSIGAVMTAISLIFLWAVAALFRCFGSEKKPMAWGMSLLLAAVFVVVVNATVSALINEPLFDIWDMLTMFILLVSATVCFFWSHFK